MYGLLLHLPWQFKQIESLDRQHYFPASFFLYPTSKKLKNSEYFITKTSLIEMRIGPLLYINYVI